MNTMEEDLCSLIEDMMLALTEGNERLIFAEHSNEAYVQIVHEYQRWIASLTNDIKFRFQAIRNPT